MLAAIMIAFRNLGKNVKKSGLLALAIFLCSTILLIAFFSFNGVERQTLRNFVNVQAGEVVVVWDDLAESDKTSPQRFINVYEALTYHPEDSAANDASLKAVADYLDQQAADVERTFPIIRRNAVIKAGDQSDTTFLTYSLSAAQQEFLVDNKSLTLTQGEFPAEASSEVVIAEAKAATLGLRVGDEVEITTLTDDGAMVDTMFTVSGLYADGAFYEGFYGYINQQTAQQIYAVPDGYYDSMLIFLNDGVDSQDFAAGLEDRLGQAGGVLHAESYLDANSFYNNTPELIRMGFAAFIVFVLLIIALGMQSSVKMSLYQRMKEIGSMRAIGFGKAQVYAMIFAETFFLTVAAFIPALLVAIGFVLFLGDRGVYVGPAASAIFGGEYFYPEIRPGQILLVLAMMLGFSLLSTIGPGLAMVNQTIVDMMARRMKGRREMRRDERLVEQQAVLVNG